MALLLLEACGSSTASSSRTQPTTTEAQAELPSCREAVHDESRLLVAALGESNAPQGLAIQLDELAASLEITWETVESLGQLREAAHQRVSGQRLPELKKAAGLVERACAGLDVPEERARSALEAALALLANGKYQEFIETYVPPADVASMKQEGQLQATVRRFEGGFGQKLRKQLEAVKAAKPTLKPDGSVEFRAELASGESSVVVLDTIASSCFLRQ